MSQRSDSVILQLPALANDATYCQIINVGKFSLTPLAQLLRPIKLRRRISVDGVDSPSNGVLLTSVIPDLKHLRDVRGRAGLRVSSLADRLAKVSQFDIVAAVEEDVPRGEISMGQV